MKQFAAALVGFVLGGVTSVVTSSLALPELQLPQVLGSNESGSVPTHFAVSSEAQAASETSQTPSLDGSSVRRCDELATHPADKNRQLTGVSDQNLALGLAISACSAAVKLEPMNPRIQFQFGRVLWESGRYEEAFEAFVEAAQEPGYGPAEKYIGDAYWHGKGLPFGEQQSANVALEWYKISAANGFDYALEYVETTEHYIKKNTFDPSLFQNPKVMESLYEGKLNNLKDHAKLFHVITGFYQFFNGENGVDHAPECKPMFSLFDMQKANAGGIFSYGDKYTSAISNGVTWDKIALSAVQDLITAPHKTDSGTRDAIQFMIHYGCDSNVGKTMMNNIKKSEAVLISKGSNLLNRLNGLLAQ